MGDEQAGAGPMTMEKLTEIQKRLRDWVDCWTRKWPRKTRAVLEEILLERDMPALIAEVVRLNESVLAAIRSEEEMRQRTVFAFRSFKELGTYRWRSNYVAASSLFGIGRAAAKAWCERNGFAEHAEEGGSRRD